MLTATQLEAEEIEEDIDAVGLDVFDLRQICEGVMSVYGHCDCCEKRAFLGKAIIIGITTYACAECFGLEPHEFDEDDACIWPHCIMPGSNDVCVRGRQCQC